MEIVPFPACLGLCLGCAGGTATFWLLLSCAWVVSRLSPPHVFPWEWAGHEQEVGRSQLRQTDQEDIACHTSIIPSANWGKVGLGEAATAGAWLSVGLLVAGGERLHLHHSFGVFLVLFASFIKLSLS